MREIKVAFFDFDGTLRIEKDGYVPDSAIRTLCELKKLGIHLIVCSASSYERIIELLGNELFDCFVCYNGALIYDKRGDIIHFSPISEDDAKRLKQYFFNHDYSFVFKHLSGRKDRSGNDPWDDFYKRFFKGPNIIQNVSNDQADLKSDPLLFGTVKLNHSEKIDPLILSFPNLRFSKVFDDYYDFSSSLADKGISVRYILKKDGYSRSESVSFGDSANDISMFRHTGYSIAMADGDLSALQAADYVTDSARNNGIEKAYTHIFNHKEEL